MHISENFLYFIWQFKLLNTNLLYCEDGEALKVLNPGILNKHAGPDFNHAQLKIGHTEWAGNIEIHIKSSDWLQHGHQHNDAFDAVILHVVYQNDKPIYRKNGTLIPVLVLKGLFSEHLLVNYDQMMNAANPFPCAKQIGTVDPILLAGFLCRVIVERFEQKSEEVLQKLAQLKGDWDETFYHFIAKSFGFKVNAVPFELLAGTLPSQLFAKHKNNAGQIAALIFGQAGFLDQTFSEEYPNYLQQEYGFFKKKYQLKQIEVSLWKFLRMRPQNFPTIRLAQFAALVSNTNHLFANILETNDLKAIYRLFEKLPVNDYWLTHYHFNKNTRQVNLQLGKESVQNIIINTICLFLFAYGRYTDQELYIDRALRFLEELPAEHNAILSQYVESGVKIEHAFISQALLQLNKCYCTQKKCLNCGIGIKILRR